MALDQKLVRRAEELMRTHNSFARPERETYKKMNEAKDAIEDYVVSLRKNNAGPINSSKFKKLLDDYRMAAEKWNAAYQAFQKDPSMDEAEKMDRPYRDIFWKDAL